jgi:DNA polymerase-4
MQQPIPYSTIFIDMDSFFASVEQFYNPKLRGRPVGVATGTSGGASIVAASVEAKRFGVRGGIKVGDARLKCPEIVIVHDSPNSYRGVHRQIMDILHATPCYVRAQSIDEAYLLVPSYMRTRQSTLALIKAIKASIYTLFNEHISSSMGIASNIWLAKMASNYKKPRGLVVLGQNDLPGFYKSLTLVALTGINYRMARRLYSLGIFTPYDLFQASASFFKE